MMGQPATAARELTYWDFTAMRHEWNRRHKPDTAKAPAPTAERVQRAFSKIPAAAFGSAH